MEKLISYKAYRLLNIAEVLSTNKRIYSLEDFMRINNSSNVTAMSDIEELLSDWNDVLKIKDHGKTYYGFGTSSSDLMFFKSNILRNQIKIRFLLNIYLYPNNSIIDHALELDYSESHLRKQVADINTFLEDYESAILYNKSQKSYRIESKEPIRLAVVMSEIIMVSGLDKLITEKMREEGNILFNQYRKDYPPGYLVDRFFQRFFSIWATYEHNYKEASVEKFFEVKEYIDSQRNIIKRFVKEHFREINISVTSKEIEKMVDIISYVGLKGTYIVRKVNNIMNRYDIFYRKLKKSQPRNVDRVIRTLLKIGDAINISCKDFQGELMYHLYANFYYLFQITQKKVGVHSDLGVQHATYFRDFFSEQFKEHQFVIYEEKIVYDFVVASSGVWAKNNLEDMPYILVSDYPTDVDVQNVFKLLDTEKLRLDE